MEFNETDITIEKYIQGELSGEPLKEFELQIENDKDLQKKVNLYQYTDAVLFDNLSRNKNAIEVNAKFKSNLEELGQTFFRKESANELHPNKEVVQEEAVVKSPIIKRLLPFATLAAVAALLLFFFLPKEQNNLYETYFEPHKLLGVHNQINNLTDFEQANTKYGAEKYEEAIVLYDRYLNENSGNPRALVYKACSHMVLAQTDEAINTFKQLLEQHSDFGNIAHWYLALCYLKKKDEAETKNQLKQISKDNKMYFDKAQQLLEELQQ